MPKYYEIYDNEEVQGATRRQAGRLVGFVVCTACVSLLIVPLVLNYGLSLFVALPIIAGIWGGALWIAMKRLRQLRRIVWCIKLSQDRILGYNYARRPASIRWEDIECVDFTNKGIFVHGPERGQFLHVTDLFSEYAELGHRILALADEYHIPLFVDGQFLEELSVYELCPFLTDASSHRAW